MKSIINYIYEKLNSFNVWIMCGLPGSGKSTYIKKNLPKNIEIINQDQIRVELGIMNNINKKKIGNSEQEKEVRKINFERIDNCINNRKDFIVDNTNIKSGYVQNLYDRLKKVGADVKIIIIDTPIEICKERRKNDIPAKVLDDMQLGIDKVKKKFSKNKDTEIINNSY